METSIHERMETTLNADTDLRVIETLYHVANGYIGVRNAPEEGHSQRESIRGTYLNAFYEIVDVAYGEKLYGFVDTKQVLVNVPDAQTISIEARDIPYSLFAPETHDVRQSLDMHTATATRTSRWTVPGGGTLFITFERMASFLMPNVFILRCCIRSEDFEGSLRLRSSLQGDVRNHAAPDDPRVAAEPLRCLYVDEMGQMDGAAFLTAKTLRSGLSLACYAAHTCPLPGQWQQQESCMEEVFEGHLAHGQTLEMIKYVVYTDSLRFPNPKAEGARLLMRAMDYGAHALAIEQQKLLAIIHREAFPVLTAPDPLPKALAFSLFQLLQSTGCDGLSSVSAKGLSGEGYEGHTFWDSEIYVFPFFLWTQPERARSMLDYRCSLLKKARVNARLLGLSRGALFPWRTISGEECSAYFPSGAAQYHINGDIAYAFLQYWLVTGDKAFMADRGAEVLVETARLWMELGHMEADGFRIDCVTGPDEYTCLVNNNFYTNAMAQANLRGASLVMAALTHEGMDAKVRQQTGITQAEEALFTQAAQRMYFPKDANHGISAQDDSFLNKKKLDISTLPPESFPLLLHYHPLFLYRHQVCKQADTVLAHLLCPDTADEQTIRRSFHYYDSVTTHDSSLSVCVFGAMAARLGMQSRAKRSFAQTVTLDLLDTHGNTKDGLHTANMGGAYLMILSGFAGIRADNEGLHLSPCLPDGWNAYTLPLRYRGRTLSLHVQQEIGTTLRLLHGEALPVQWYGIPQILNDILQAELPTAQEES